MVGDRWPPTAPRWRRSTARREAYQHAHVRIDATGQPVEAVVDVLLDRSAS